MRSKEGKRKRKVGGKKAKAPEPSPEHEVIEIGEDDDWYWIIGCIIQRMNDPRIPEADKEKIRAGMAELEAKSDGAEVVLSVTAEKKKKKKG